MMKEDRNFQVELGRIQHDRLKLRQIIIIQINLI
jgi:hypothetical protein